MKQEGFSPGGGREEEGIRGKSGVEKCCEGWAVDGGGAGGRAGGRKGVEEVNREREEIGGG